MQSFLIAILSFGVGGFLGWAFGAVEWQACVRGYARKHPITGGFQWMGDVARPAPTEPSQE